MISVFIGTVLGLLGAFILWPSTEGTSTFEAVFGMIVTGIGIWALLSATDWFRSAPERRRR